MPSPLDSIFKIALTKATLRITPNLKKFLNLAESCLWMQYLHYQIRSGQIKRSINVVKVNNIVNALYDAAMALSKDDNTNQYSRLCQSLQPLLNNLTHSMLLTNANLLSIFSNFMIVSSVGSWCLSGSLSLLSRTCTVAHREGLDRCDKHVQRVESSRTVRSGIGKQRKLGAGDHLHLSTPLQECI